MATIRTSSGIRFKLEDNRLIETTKCQPYYAYRRAIRQALKKAHTTIVTYFWEGLDELFESKGWVEHGVAQRNKKFISIGCMRFVGKERIALIKWAKSKAKGVQ